MTEDVDETPKRREWRGRNSNTPSGGAVYGLGFIGALVYYIQQATTFWQGAFGFLKAAIWPAFLVYHLLH